MDARTPALILLCSLIAALAFAVLGLAADNIAYVHEQHDSTLDIHYLRWNSTAEAPYSYWVQIDYLPSRFSMARMNAMLGASIVTALAGVVVGIVSWMARGNKQAQLAVNLRKRSLPLLAVSLIVASIAFVISFAVAIYAWYPVMRWNINFKNSLPLPPVITGVKSKTVRYRAPFDLVPDLWNCWISDYTINPDVSGKLDNLCKEASVAKILMLPIVVLSAALVVGVGLSWWKASRATATTTEANEKDAEEVSI